MARIGLSYWGFCENFNTSVVANTPDGHRYGRPVLVDALRARGHEVIALQGRRETEPYSGLAYESEGYPDLDALFIEWRWPTYKNSGQNKFEPDLDRQIELLDHYSAEVPTIVWDTDLKMTLEDEKRWPNMIIGDPTFKPQEFILKRHILPFWSDFKPLASAAQDPVEFGYVGNNYERREMFLKYYSNPAKGLRIQGVQTKVHGNWLQRSPERQSPEVLIQLHPDVAFGPRAGFKESMSLLNSFVCTAHITKLGYAKQGFASPRYLENIIMNTPALVPIEFLIPDLLGSYWTVRDASDVIKKVTELKSFSSYERETIVLEQKAALLHHHDFSVGAVCGFIEDKL
jgi:hypothetical protein